MSELSERIKLTRKHLGMSQFTFSTAIGVKPDRIKSLETGRVKELTSLEANLMVNNFNLSLDWLVTGKGEMLKKEDRSQNELQQAPKGYALVPKYDIQASAGYGSIIHSELITDHLAFSESWLNSLLLNKNKLCLIEAKGDSMEPTLFNKDLLLIDMQQTVLNDGIYVIQYNNNLLVKRIQKKLDGTIVIKSDNSFYESEQLTPNNEYDIQVVGEVVWFGRAMA